MTYAEPQRPSGIKGDGISASPCRGAAAGRQVRRGRGNRGGASRGRPDLQGARRFEQPPKFCDAAVPNDEFYCSLDARTLDEALLKGRKRRTVSTR
jgi:hypothetical protein